MTDTLKPLRYADVLRDAAESYRAKAVHNRNQPFPEDAIVASGEVLWRAQSRRAAVLRRLAELCEQAERVAAWDNTLKTFDESRLVRDIAAGYQEGT